MRLKRKILLSLCIAVLVVLALLAGLFYYYYTHPDSIKPLLEKSISQATGTRCTINILSFSLRIHKLRYRSRIPAAFAYPGARGHPRPFR